MKIFTHTGLLVLGLMLAAKGLFAQSATMPLLGISANKRFFTTADGKPFFWLGDTGWLLFGKTTREEAAVYLEDRKQKGFNVIQIMLLHELVVVNKYDDSALINRNVATPKITAGNNVSDPLQYDFWDHVDYVIDLAATKGLYMALVPVWGGNVKDGGVTSEQAKTYINFLTNRYKNRNNIIWLNGGDIKGSDSIAVWKTIGKVLNANDNRHLITFHPRGRTSSSEWFHNEPWLDFNMFQSGHRSYAQDTSANETLHYGEDNWRYVTNDYLLKPTKPTIDGEPSYEDIPYGLHDSIEPYWKDYEIRRYAYWSVFAGGGGFTYGHNSVMQFYTPGDKGISFYPKIKWQDGMKAPGAGQMKYLKKLILSKSYFDRVPDQSLIADNGEKYDRVLATRGKDYAFFYTYNGRTFKTVLGKINGKQITAYWFNPKDGIKKTIGKFANKGIKEFNPPGEKKEGNDWVLVLEAGT
ncbi:MAG: glycoside hydrolase family 140 protein [Ferruginibacter sp.]